MNSYRFRKCLSLLLAAWAICLCAGCGTGGEVVAPAPKRDSAEIVREMVVCYGNDGDDARAKVDALLTALDGADSVHGDKWRSIMRLWQRVNGGLPLHYDALPDGLPDNDGLCIVALGYQLHSDGTMRDELVERLKVVRNSAEKYPHALIACTGGPTALNNREATEAGRMAEWPIAHGIAEDRVIVEDRSLTTAQNAMFTLGLLDEKYPQVTRLAIVSSDYHIATGVLLFGAEATLRAERAGAERFRVVSDAAWKAPSGSLSTVFQASALLELSENRNSA